MKPSGNDRHFRTDHLEADLKGRSVRGGAVTMGSQGIKFVLVLVGSNIILARILGPEPFGILAMAMAVTGLVGLFKDLGLSMATVQQKDINHGQVSTLFWLNVLISAVIALLVIGLAPAVVWFYDEPKLFWVTIGLVPGLIFSGLTVQHQALLQRTMRFGVIASIYMTSIFLGLASAIVAALYGMTHGALVLQIVATAFLTMIGMWIASGWLPGPPVRHSGVRKMIAFGGNLTGFKVINYIARNLDNVLLGAVWGDAVVGLYAKAYSLLMLPLRQVNSPLTSVAVPALSRLQDDPTRYRRYFRKALELIVTVGMPLVVFCFVAADELILATLGPEFAESADIFRALGPAAFIGTSTAATGWIYISLNFVNRQLRYAVVHTAVIICALAIGVNWGAIGVGLAFSIAMLISRPPGILYCIHPTTVRLSDFLTAMWRPASASLLAGAGQSVVLLTAGEYFQQPDSETLSSVVSLLVQMIVFTLCYTAFYVGLPGGFNAVRELNQMIFALRGRRSIET